MRWLDGIGLTTVEVVVQEDRPNRKVYHITEPGREELHRWLLTPLHSQEARSAPLIQVFFAGQLSDEQILSMFENARGQFQALLSIYEQIPQQIKPYEEMVGSPRETFFWLSTLELGIRTAKAHLEWIESVTERIRIRQHPDY